MPDRVPVNRWRGDLVMGKATTTGRRIGRLGTIADYVLAGGRAMSIYEGRTTNDNRLKPIPFPAGGFKTNEEEARWLEQTILMRAHETLRNAGLNARIEPHGLYDLLLLSLNSASKRGVERAVASQKPPA